MEYSIPSIFLKYCCSYIFVWSKTCYNSLIMIIQWVYSHFIYNRSRIFQNRCSLNMLGRYLRLFLPFSLVIHIYYLFLKESWFMMYFVFSYIYLKTLNLNFLKRIYLFPQFYSILSRYNFNFAEYFIFFQDSNVYF